MDGDGKMVFWMALGDLDGFGFGCEIAGFGSRVVPICITCSSVGSLAKRLGKSSSSKRSRFCSRAAASGKW